MHIKALHIKAPLGSTSAPLGEASALALHLAPVRDTHYSGDLIAMISPVITPSLMAVLALRGNYLSCLLRVITASRLGVKHSCCCLLAPVVGLWCLSANFDASFLLPYVAEASKYKFAM